MCTVKTGPNEYKFQSTPSARRATAYNSAEAALNRISIHALREEGDDRFSYRVP